MTHIKCLAFALAFVWGITIGLLLLTGCGGADFSAGIQPETDAATDVDARPWSGPGPRPAPEPIGKLPHQDAGLEASSEAGDSGSELDTFVPPVDAGDAGSDTGCMPLTHSDGLGQTYLDCASLGQPGNASTYSMTMAQEAATAWGADVTGLYQCVGLPNTCLGGESDAGDQRLWCFTGPLVGHVNLTRAEGCPTVSSPTWN